MIGDIAAATVVVQLSKNSGFVVAYVITSDGRDVHADMALVSMLSVRISNPGLRIVAVCDKKSAQAIKSAKHRMLEVCDELVSVATPDGDPTFRNRWVKTQLCNFVSGYVLYVDADTLVRGSLADLPQLVLEFGAVPNHNGANLADQFWAEDRDFCLSMNWSVNFESYMNGGVWFFKPCRRVHEFFAKWHELWLAGMKTNGRLRDQPSLNSAMASSRMDVKILPARFNTQLFSSWNRASEALIWHFYATVSDNENSFGLLVKIANTLQLHSLRRRVAKTLKTRAPWPNQDWLAQCLVRGVESRGTAKTEEKLWLSGRRLGATRFALGKARQRLTHYFR